MADAIRRRIAPASAVLVAVCPLVGDKHDSARER